MESQRKDVNDDRVFREHRNSKFGENVKQEFNQSNPMLFDKHGKPLNIENQYFGSSVFFLSNGPSLSSGRYDLSLLDQPGFMTFGINNGAATYRPNIWSCVDDPSRFMSSIWLDPRILKVVPQNHHKKAIFDNDKWEYLKENGRQVVVGDCPNMAYFHRNNKFDPAKYLTENTVNWGNHKDYGGGRSVMISSIRLLYILGFRNIFLLGADFNMTEESAYHFDQDRHQGSVRGNMKTYKRMNEEYFPSVLPYFKKAGLNVYNCTEGSKMTCFPKMSYEDALKIAKSRIGNPNASPEGMYNRFDEEQKKKKDAKKKREQARQKKNSSQFKHVEVTKEKAEKINKVYQLAQNNKIIKGSEIFK